MKINIKENIRSLVNVDDSELRSSLQTFGWHKEFPALQDETGNILVGHRRIKLAKEIGIEPVIKTIQLAGNDADGFKLALISNIGHAPLRPKDRQAIATHLYGTGEWVMAEIAKALGVTHKTISKDLRDFVPEVQIKKHAKTDRNPRSAGRRKSKLADKMSDIVAMKDAGKSAKIIAKATGIHERNVHQVLEHEQIARDARLEASVTPEMLSLTAQQKLEIAIKREKNRLAQEFNAAVEAKIDDQIGSLLKKVKADQLQAFKDMQVARSGGFKFKKSVYKKIQQCLHADSRNSISDARLGEAFDAFTQAERFLIAPEEMAASQQLTPLPTTREEALAARERVRQERSQKAREQNARRQKVK